MLLLLISLLGILLHHVSANTSSCSLEDLRSCRSDALDLMNNPSGSDSEQQEKQCRNLRENFDCMLWQTSMCFKTDEHDSNSEAIMKTWRYLSGFCEKYGNWWASPCFQRDDIKRCESLLPSKKNSVDASSCRMFVNFRDCVASIAENDCSSSDRRLLGTYFMEKGQQMAWRCSKDKDESSTMSVASAQQVDRRYNYDSPSGSYEPCVASSRNELTTCQDRFQNTQNDALRRDDSDMRNHRMCCGMVHFEECVRDALSRRCNRDVRRLTEDFVYPVRSRLNNACRDHTTYICNTASGFVSPNAVAVHIALYFLFFMYMKKF